jgi:predicted AlkP superfamily pyrophosphatase or phosphodiesterase
VPVPQKLLVIQLAALGWNVAERLPGFRPAETFFPALTCPFQASLRTGFTAGEHGLIANGLFFPELTKVLFWEQSHTLVQGPRLWDGFRERGGKVGLMFWQQSMGERADLVVTPAPIHKHSGGMIQSCYTQPARLERWLNEQIGRPFNLMNYWGPLANHKSSDWIVEAICAVVQSPQYAPDVLFAYIPHLDYDLQRYGPDSSEARRALDFVIGYLARVRKACETAGWDWIFVGDYAIEPVTRGAVFPNRALREAGLFVTREIKGMDYTDFFSSRAFAVVDHQVANVHCKDAASRDAAADVLAKLPGVAEVLDRKGQERLGIAGRHTGELFLVAEQGAWFAYPWFEKSRAPDYATHVDIHNKPGYDPCELFFGWPPLSVSFDTSKIRGAHGRVGAGYEVGWNSSLAFEAEPKSVMDLTARVRSWMDSRDNA